MHKDGVSRTNSNIALKLQTISSDTATNGEIIDSQGYESLKLITAVGTVSAGDVTVSAIKESDDSGMAGATDVPTARLIGTNATLDTSDTLDEIGVVLHKQYVRATYTTANSANLVVGSIAELGHAQIASSV
jgi:hypothetical protein